MSKKKIALSATILLSTATVGTVIYFWAQSYLNEKSVKNDNKVQYHSFMSESDKFISEEVA